ncbi:DUF1501 domain-containing protein [Methylobacterium indicum]|uniref:DUF1501 domain-containing protein n=1 Tax=Methylobacterium indicum TaxID=1775910 RepID=A0ABR5H293_9HYPH|nr:DUF1501 domain-containing protein [Methylobacterium indicum]KMO15554.1 hypothetical protein QR78_21015 [Methylobacterium indicum]KMO17399.1 hypothetical protein QR79_21765 [Methylobacterium indicum]
MSDHADLCETHPSRRRILGTAGALFAWSAIPRTATAAPGARDARLVVVVLRGALDGLSAVAPLGDPAYADLRPGIALTRDGPGAALPLDGFFALHPALPTFARLYAARQALVVHACATGYRERSHFDGQDVLESGQPGPGHTASGWLNRLVAALPAGEGIAPRTALGVGVVPPLILRGPAPVLGWAPPRMPRASDELARRVLALYEAGDPALAASLARGLDVDALAKGRPKEGGPKEAGGLRGLAEGAARLVAADDGPRIAALALDGWDTHANEGGATGRLAGLLGGLDGVFSAFAEVLAPRWADTAILVVTEFGRTARVNGTTGTDHGTGTVAFLLGGAVRGGRVLADWPGLAPARLYQGRDLAPTTDLRAVAKGLAADLFGLSPAVLGRSVFPGTEALRPVGGLVV